MSSIHRVLLNGNEWTLQDPWMGGGDAFLSALGQLPNMSMLTLVAVPLSFGRSNGEQCRGAAMQVSLMNIIRLGMSWAWDHSVSGGGLMGGGYLPTIAQLTGLEKLGFRRLVYHSGELGVHEGRSSPAVLLPCPCYTHITYHIYSRIHSTLPLLDSFALDSAF